MLAVALRASVEEVGRQLPSSKIRQVWLFDLQGRPQQLCLTISKYTNRYRLFLNELLIAQDAHFNGDAYSFSVLGVSARLVRCPQSHLWELYLDNRNFNRLYRFEGGPSRPHLPPRSPRTTDDEAHCARTFPQSAKLRIFDFSAACLRPPHDEASTALFTPGQSPKSAEETDCLRLFKQLELSPQRPARPPPHTFARTRSCLSAQLGEHSPAGLSLQSPHSLKHPVLSSYGARPAEQKNDTFSQQFLDSLPFFLPIGAGPELDRLTLSVYKSTRSGS